jgi:two-component sensor histidine kinase
MTLEGPSVLIGAKAATAMTLVLHELATNASKYGSLSVHDGRLRVLWAHDDAALELTWREDDGPPIQGPPLAEGFGSQLARMSVTEQLAGDIVRDWRPEGLEVRIRLPLGHIA